MKTNIIQGDSLTILKTIGSETVDCVITSPPYFQLRKYGDDDMELGREKSITDYIANMKSVFSEVYRVMKNEATCFVNISDTYNGNKAKLTNQNKKRSQGDNDKICKQSDSTIQERSLCLIPERFVIAMAEIGFVIRNHITWIKPDAMPESVKNRFTADTEQIYFMTKIPTGYYFKTQHEKMKTIDTTRPRGSLGNELLNSGRRSTLTHGTFRVSSSRLNARNENEINTDKRLQENKQDALGKNTYTGFNSRYEPPKELVRQLRSSWEISTEGISEAHFATFPRKLVERMILSGCPLEDGRIVLDPFCGSGTTGMVAKEYGLDFIGIELYQKNVELSRKRIDSIVSYVRLFEGL